MMALSLIITALAPVYHLPVPTPDIFLSCPPGCGRIHLVDINDVGPYSWRKSGPQTQDRRHSPGLRVVPGGDGCREARRRTPQLEKGE